MKKFFLTAFCTLMTFCAVSAQSDDDFFFDDDLFADDVTVTTSENSSGSSDLSHGVIFENGSVKLGGNIDTALKLNVPLYDPNNDGNTLGDNIYNSTVTPTADAQLFVDARPTQNLRLYTKFGWNYPYEASFSGSVLTAAILSSGNPALISMLTPGATIPDISLGTSRLYIKELFTDFSIADRVFFRFGQHTVSWGTGYFFSPVSDMINTSSIDPENPTAQVNGSLNLRAQVVFPGSMNTLWFYVVPSANFDQSGLAYARDTALAAKGEFVFGGWEIGAGALYKYHSAPKIMFTASGSIFKGKVAVFGESVFQYGTAREWAADGDSWADKTFVAQATVGASYTWKDPKITFMAQYMFDGNFDDDKYTTQGNNLALTVMFQKVGIEKLSATLVGVFYFGKEDVSMNQADSNYIATLMQKGYNVLPTSAIASAMLSWSPAKNISLSGGPYFTWQSFSKAPTVSFQLTAKLGGGSF